MSLLKNLFHHHRYITSIILRYLVIIITEYLYYNYAILYTDIDYHVFSDGARHVAIFESPYERETYRYTPLLAVLMIPNIKIWYPIGKFLLSTIDVGVGYLIELLLKSQDSNSNEEKTFNDIIKEKKDESYYAYASLFYLYNPLTIVICTRGSADCIITFLVLLSLIYLEKKKYYLSALIYGFAVHFKIYPIIYAPSLFLYLIYKEFVRDTSQPLEPVKFCKRICFKLSSTLKMAFKYLFTKVALSFTIISSGIFFLFLLINTNTINTNDRPLPIPQRIPCIKLCSITLPIRRTFPPPRSSDIAKDVRVGTKTITIPLTIPDIVKGIII